MKLFRFISKLIVGLVFTFSGFVKCLDPLGTAYKINDYLVAFELTQFTDLAVVLSVLMCGLELLIGIMLLFHIKINWAAWAALVFMIIYTPLTLYIAIFNPVTDCGCFGDALILSNWDTFFKNVILIALTLVLFLGRKTYTELFNPFVRYIAFLVLMLGVFGFEWYSLNRLPIMDFRPYAIGVNIPESMIIPEDAPETVIESVFIYERNGTRKEFTLNNLPSAEAGWVFVDRIDQVISEGYEPPIHDFSMTTNGGQDITWEVLNGGYVGLLVAYDLNEASTKNMLRINMLATLMQDAGHRFICLTASPPETIDRFRAVNQTVFEYANTDPTTLKTIIRSNPGLVLIKNGTILNKWHHKHLPTIEELDRNIQIVEY